MIHSSLRLAFRWALFVSPGLFILPSGCTTHQSNQQRVMHATQHIEDPIRALEARAELEMLGSTDRVGEEVIRQIIPDASPQLLLGTPAYQRAFLDADAIALAAYQAMHSSETSTEKEPPRSIGIKRKGRAAKLYTQARSLNQQGELAQAIELLEQAARVDPNSGAIHGAIGDALILSNDRVGAIAAYQKALELGDHSVGLLIHLAAEASTRNDHDRVIWLTNMALENRSIHRQPMIEQLAGVLLGRSQLLSGHLQAGCQTLEQSLGAFDTPSRDPRWRREMIMVLNERLGLWIQIGDAWASLGAHERAQEAYQLAMQAPQSDTTDQPQRKTPTPLVARQIASALRQGYTARASLIFLDHLAGHAHDLSSEERLWAKTLAGIDGVGDVLGAAIGQLSTSPSITASTRRQLLDIELSTLSPQAAVLGLANAGSLADDPTLSLQVFSRIADPEVRYQAVITILESNPAIARGAASGYSRTLANPVSFLAQHAMPKTAEQELLLASVGLGLGRADLVPHLDTLSNGLSADRLASMSNQWLSAHSQAFSFVGDWESVSKLIAELKTRSLVDDHIATSELVSTLMIAQQPTQAAELAYLIADDSDASVSDLMLGSQIAQSQQDYETSVSYLERASQLDPFDTKIWEQLFLLRSPGSPIGDGEELQFVARQLATNRPRSSLLGLIRATELARNGYLSEAETLLLELNAKHPYHQIGFDLLMSIWKTQSTNDQTGGQTNALIDGAEWLALRVDDDPTSVDALLKASQGYFELDDHIKAMDILAQGYARTGSFELARAIEQLLAQDDKDAANLHLVDRLAGQHGVDALLEYASYLAVETLQDQEQGDVFELLRSGLPDALELHPNQQAVLSQIIFTRARSIETLNNDEELLDLISLLEQRSASLRFEVSRIKVLLLAQSDELDLDELVESIVLSMSQAKTQEQRDTLWSLPIQVLIGDDREHLAISLLGKLATASGSLNTRLSIELYRLLASRGTNSDMIGVIEHFEQLDLMSEALNFVQTELGSPGLATPGFATTDMNRDQQWAELIYSAAVLASAFNREEQSMAYYELSLSYDPDHPWSNNDYGYMLAEKGVRIEFAVELLERAAKALPENSSVIDSLAWVRYKMGIIADVTNDDGSVTLGAISLLTRADQLDIKRENATIMLHLGDALWRGGFEEMASDAWLGAEDIVRSQIRLIHAQENPNQNAIDAMSVELREIRYRLQDAESTGKPAIAPLADEQADDEIDKPAGGL